MFHLEQAKWTRALAFSLALGLVSVWLVGSCAALTSTIYAAKHSCCNAEKVADACSTLCASSDWDSTLSVESLSFTPPVALSRPIPATPISARFAMPVLVATVSHSPPLYIQHAALLI